MNNALRIKMLSRINEWLQQYMESDDFHTFYMAASYLEVSRKTLYTLRNIPDKVSDRTIKRVYEKSLQYRIEFPKY